MDFTGAQSLNVSRWQNLRKAPRKFSGYGHGVNLKLTGYSA